MQRIHTVTPETPEVSTKTLSTMSRRMGLTLGIHATATSSPAVINAYVTLVAGATTGYVDDATSDAAPDAGWTQEQLTETFTSVMANRSSNYLNHCAGTELHLPAAPAS